MPKQSDRGGAASGAALSPADRRGAASELGSLEDARRVLWAALKRAERSLKARDHATALRGVHAVSQCAAAYTRLVEVSELEARITALEEGKP
ncbi:hypothetical protein [Deinococcus alpinitundrae]|uniref:hypothetical protein n=1 Tax=Deinococcus alpinitundrae TaxID=468913 RepID=UPI00137AF98F|nr:hypothetical protein [Deinococcus alpinitundrae]